MGESSRACPISLHVPTSAMQFGPDIIEPNPPAADKGAASTSSANQTPRRPHPGGLDTLPEASHVNALAQATGPSPAGLGSTPQGIESLLDAALQGLSPPSRSLAVTRAKGYAGITVELTNERWRERWSRLCLASAEDAQLQQASSSNQATANPAVWKAGDPGGMGGSWELLAHLSGAGGLGIPFETSNTTKGMTRSSSRGVMAAKQKQKEDLSAMMSRSNESIGSAVGREAEEWRRAPTFHRGEVNLSKYEETEGVTAVISPWLELDSLDEGVRFDAEIALRQEVSYASHIGISQVILPPPSSDPACRPYLADYARAIAGCLSSRGAEAPAAGHFMKFVIRLPISSPHNLAQTLLRNGQTAATSSGSLGSVSPAQLRSDDDWAWQTWHFVQNICLYTSRLSVALDLSAPLPMSYALQRWTAEPVSHIWLPARAFLSNAKGYPVLSKASQSLLRTIISAKAPSLSFIVIGSQSPPSHHQRGGQAAYEQYIRHLEKSAPAPSALDVQARGYADYLQAPLQPLFDNLEGQTYATFEADAIKYERYEDAIYQALLARPSRNAVRIWVCGAGRGPLVDRALRAAKRASRTVKVVALEKNVNAVVGLRERAALEWGEDVVEVQCGDMRKVRPPKEKADILVSELLGSFGDNELSPECLDGAIRFMKADGICIPRAYTSYITPISTPRLHADVLSSKGVSTKTDRSRSTTVDLQLKSAETPYVVFLKAFTNLAATGGRGDWADLQDCWTFEHKGIRQTGIPLDEDDLPITNSHNVRTSTHTFHIPNQGVCHGLAGYFEAHLFGDVVLSIHPDPTRATKDMMSWFPFFFPFKDPIYLAPNSELDVHMWRLTSSGRVWYEWMAEAHVPIPRPITSGNGVASGAGAQGAAGVGGQGQRNASGTSDASTDVAFQNAPLTPRFAEMGLGMPSTTASQQQRNNTGVNGNGYEASLSVVKVGGEEMQRRVSSGSGQGGAMNSSMGRVENHGAEAIQGYDRVKVGMSALMNPGGRSSWVGM